MASVRIIKDDSKFYRQIFLEKALFVKYVRGPTRWWDWCMSKDEKRVIKPMFTDKYL